MKHSNILLKLIIILTLAIGWSGHAWAQVTIVPSQMVNGKLSDDTHWYTLKNVRANSYLSTATTYMDNNGLMLNRSNQSTVPTVNEGLWCFVDNGDGTYSIYNRAMGPNYRLGTTTNQSDANTRTKFFGINETIPSNVEIRYVYQASTYNTGGATGIVIKPYNTNKFLDDSRGQYLTVWNNASSPIGSNGNCFIVEEHDFGCKVVIEGGSSCTVSYGGTTYESGRYIQGLQSLNTKNLNGFTLNNASGKFIYGPVVSKAFGTVTYTVSDPATGITEGWYQMQVANNNNINSKINAFSGNINTQSPQVYAMAMVNERLDNGSNYFGMKYSGVPDYAGEASTYVYLKPTNGTATQILLPTGHYMINNGGTSRTATDVTTRFQNNMLATRQWVESNATNWNEAPAAAASDGYPRNMYLRKIDVSPYSVYKVVIEGWTAGANISADPTVTIADGSAATVFNQGLAKVYNNGYYFLSNSYEPTAEDFTLRGTSFDDNFTISIGSETDGVRTITFREVQTSIPFRVIITGQKKDDEVIRYQNRKRFLSTIESVLADGTPDTARDNEYFYFKVGTTESQVLDCDFTSSAASRTSGTSFVYGPVIDWENHTITCEIREAITSMPSTGWYQLKYDVSTNNATPANRYTQAREDEFTRPTRDANRFYLTMPKEGNAGRSEYTNYSKYPNDVTTPLTFVKLVRSGNGIMMMTIDGRYLQEAGTPSTSGSGYVNPVQYVDGELDFQLWFPFGNNPSFFTGKASSTHNYFFTTPAKFDDDRYDFYEVFFHYEGTEDVLINRGSVVYTGSATNYSTTTSSPTVYSGGYLVFDKGTTLQASELTINDVEPESITIDKENRRIKIQARLPKISHRRAYFYDKLEATAEANRPGYGYVGTTVKGDNGMVTREDGIEEQKTSVFEIPVYLSPNSSRTLYMPSDMIQYYQRWYNYDTDGLVDAGVMPALYSENFKLYSNGHVSGTINGNSGKGYTSNPTFYLPTTLPTETIDGKTYYKDYLVAMDFSRYKDTQTDGYNLTEPTLSQRVIYRIMDARKIADEIKQKTEDGDWYEKREIIFPCKKRGSSGNRNTGADIVPLNMDLWNYWAYNGTTLTQLTGDSQISVELDPSSTTTLGHYHLIDGTGGISRVNFNQGHFITFTYPAGNVVEDNKKAVLNVYLTVGSTRYNLAQFTLNFQPNVEPQIITDVMGIVDEETFVNERSPRAMEKEFGAPVAEMNFDTKRIDVTLPTSLVDNYARWSGWNIAGQYEFPLDFSMSSYGYGYGNSSGTSRGEYSITKDKVATGGNTYTFKPVKAYYDLLDGISEFNSDDDYIIYVDAADQAGQVMSIPIEGSLCPGTRLYCYGWIASNAGSSNPASVLLSIVGHDQEGNSVTLASYCPGMLSPWGYRNSDDTQVYSFNPTTLETTTAHGPNSNWGLWQQIGFSFLVDGQTLAKYNSYTMDVYNNCYNSSGGDYLLDNFQIFAAPPKGEVDFTTPLCTDKTRHAKIHTDFNMLKNISGINTNTAKSIPVTYCFLDKEIFDDYEEYGMRIGDMFEENEHGNHNLKPEYDGDDTNVINIINHAFRKALVGSRYNNSSGREDHGFHSPEVAINYEDIPEYAYNDSKVDQVYREIDEKGVQRILFKENVIRGEMDMVPAEPGKEETHPAYWPHMRPQRWYYLVFAPVKATQEVIDYTNTATHIFNIQESCSFFGKFRTHDPLHVILDNADIESDLPIRAVCHGETTAFSFDLPAMKANKPIVDEAYCISDESLNGKVVPSSQGVHHYRYEESFKNDDIAGVIKNMPYDWWMGGTLEEQSYRGTIDDYLVATHPSIVYNHDTTVPSHTHTHSADYKKHGEPVSISLAMEDFRFYYPDFGKDKFDPATGKNNISEAEWNTLEVHDYDNDSGYSLLQSDINAIKSFVNAGIIVLHRNTYDMPLTYEEAEELQAKEVNDLMEKEMNDQILELAFKLDDDPAILAMKPLKQLEGTIIGMLSAKGRERLTFEELGSLTLDQLKDIAGKLKSEESKMTDVTIEQINAMPEGELRRAVESALKSLSEQRLHDFAKKNFPDIGHEKRAYLITRALNILSRETVANLSPEEQQNPTATRQALREQMIAVFSAQDAKVLRKMWSDSSSKLTEEERAALLEDKTKPGTKKDPATMDAAGLAVLVEDCLAQITNNVLNELKSDRYVHFTLVPIMPSQKTFVDEPYIFCPEPRGVKIRLTSHAPRMLDGFADMNYPAEMTNVPVRVGLAQIKETKASAEKTLRIPVRGLRKAAQTGVKAVKLDERTGYYNEIFLAETDDPRYQQTVTDGMAEAKNVEGTYTRMVGTVQTMVANYPTSAQPTPDNYLIVKFKDDMQFREGYTYRVGINFMEHDSENHATISCPGEMQLDLKIVPEYQKWTATVNSDWTNDKNWARADRDELNANNTATGSVIDGSTDITAAANYPTNNVNQTSKSFVPMYFTNVILDNEADNAAMLYTEKESETAKDFKPASRSEKTFLEGLHSTATEDIEYDMEVVPSTGAWHTNGNYECGLFGTYIANGITFLPGSQLVNAHFLDYKKAWVEYELDVNRWYTLASPLQNTFAGEWYAPNLGGRQVTPHFYTINYSHDLNDRFRPAIYQRSWDSKGNNPVYLKTGGMYDAFIKADWSHVYNDVTKEYSNGGFSVKVDDYYMDKAIADGKALVRMPKADVKYTYYDVNNETGQKADDNLDVTSARYRLWSDELSDADSFSQTITNVSADNNFFLVGNPFMANMDMDEFFRENTGLEEKFWIMTTEGQAVSVKVDNEAWVGTSGSKVAPLQGFFVKSKSGGNSTTVKFTAAMQSEPSANQQLRIKRIDDVEEQSLTITAKCNEHTSTAIVLTRDGAKSDYVPTEDCETFIDGNTADAPTVYTVASNQAMSVNTVPGIDMLPLGLTCEEDGEAEVTFSGTDRLIYLYDARSKRTVTLAPGEPVALTCNDARRYYISLGNVSGIDAPTVEEADSDGIAYDLSGRPVVAPMRGTIVIKDGRKTLIK